MHDIEPDTTVGIAVSLGVMCCSTAEAARVAEVLARPLVALGADGLHASLSITALADDDQDPS